MAPPITPDIEKLIFELYYKKGFLFGRDKLYKKAVELQIPISRRQVADWLNKQEINQLFRQTKPAVKTKPTILSDNNKQIGIDLIDFRNYSYNGYEWILTAIDLFSKKAYAIPMKNKNDITTANAMKKILEQINQPISTIRSDNGSEFVSKQFKKLMKDYNIKQIFSLPNNPQSNGQVERFNGILKTLVRKHRYYNDTYDWVANLQSLVDNYNSSYHFTTKNTPNNIETADNELKATVKKNITKKVAGKLEKDKILDINDNQKVRIKQTKGEETPWSTETYTISKILKPKSNIANTSYYLKGLNRNFYNNDILLVPPDTENIIEKPQKYEISSIVRPVYKNGVKGYMIKWKGYKELGFQSRNILIEDVPKMIKDYEKKNNVEWSKVPRE